MQVDHDGLALERNAACFSNSAALLCWFWCSAEHIAPNELFTDGQKLNVPWCANTQLAALNLDDPWECWHPTISLCVHVPACTFKVTTQLQMPWEMGIVLESCQLWPVTQCRMTILCISCLLVSSHFTVGGLINVWENATKWDNCGKISNSVFKAKFRRCQ